MTAKKVYYIWDENLITECNRLPAVSGRASMVHDLIVGYELHKNLKVVRSSRATYDDLRKFHSEVYVDYLKSINEIEDDYMASPIDEEHGIGYDCPPVSNMFDLVSSIAGGSISAAKCLVYGTGEVAINWCGGWHHAQRFAAEGFCYINDIVLAIETLKEKFPKVLYIDLDVHHGNGVQDAYNLSKSVFTLSIHKYEPGFYPGSGGIDDIGILAGKGYSCNVPLHAWYSDDTLEYIFEEIFPDIYNSFAPDAIVVQCGADALAHDPHGGAKLTSRGYCTCVNKILQKQKPTILLGGGGYKHTNAARLWTELTALVLEQTLDEIIPDNEYWDKYGPDYTIQVETMLTKDINTKEYLDQVIRIIKENLNTYVRNNSKQESAYRRSVMQQQKETTKHDPANRKIYDENIKDTQVVNDVYEFDDT